VPYHKTTAVLQGYNPMEITGLRDTADPTDKGNPSPAKGRNIFALQVKELLDYSFTVAYTC